MSDVLILADPNPRDDTPARNRLSRKARKLMVTAHVLSSVGWFGAAGLIGVLALTAGSTGDPVLAHAVYRTISTSVWVTLGSGALALATGVTLSIGTTWGVIRHWWVAAKLGIAVAVVLTDLVVIRRVVGDALRTTNPPPALFGATVAHFVVLGIATALSIYKPWGLTPYGRRRTPSRANDASQRTQTATRRPSARSGSSGPSARPQS